MDLILMLIQKDVDRVKIKKVFIFGGDENPRKYRENFVNLEIRGKQYISRMSDYRLDVVFSKIDLDFPDIDYRGLEKQLFSQFNCGQFLYAIY